MKTLGITIVVETIIVVLLLIGTLNLRDQLKETQSKLTEAQASYERCVDKNERFQELYQSMVNENAHLLEKIRKYEPHYGMIPLKR